MSFFKTPFRASILAKKYNFCEILNNIFQVAIVVFGASLHGVHTKSILKYSQNQKLFLNI